MRVVISRRDGWIGRGRKDGGRRRRVGEDGEYTMIIGRGTYTRTDEMGGRWVLDGGRGDTKV